MRPTILLILCIAFVALIGGCSREKAVALSVEFPGNRQFRYSIDASVHGSITSIDTIRSFESSAQCTLTCVGNTKNKAMFHAIVAFAKFNSTILGKDELDNLTQQAREVKLLCDLGKATIVPDGSTDLPLIRIGEWDVFTDLLKALPALPNMNVKKGASWDREKTIPLDTRQGKATGHMYQSFKLDSIYLSPKKHILAHILWDFTYQIDIHDRDSLKILDRMPSRGVGKGQAFFDVTEKRLDFARASFSVPQANEGLYKISWNEIISLRFVQ